MDPAEILKHSDLCRPGHQEDRDDVLQAALAADPTAAALFARAQAAEQRLAEALHKVPVPTGLAERILARLQAVATDRPTESTCSTESACSTEPVTCVTIQKSPPMSSRWSDPRTWTRKEFLVASLGTSAAALAGWLGWNWQQRPDQGRALHEYVADGMNWYSVDQAAGLARAPLSTAPATTPLSPEIQVRYVQGWAVATSGALARTLYFLSGPRGRAQGMLYVRALDGQPRLNSRPSPFANTGAIWATAWQDPARALLYVLVIQGTNADRQAVGSFLVNHETLT